MNALVPAEENRMSVEAGFTPQALVPNSLAGVWKMSQIIAESGVAPKDMDTPQKISVAIMHGLELGMTPMTALQSIAVVNGRPTVWGDGAIGLIRGSGKMEWIKERIEGAGDEMNAICEIKRKGEATPSIGQFSVHDAKTAALWTKAGPWKQYPKRMLQMRARAFALRDGFADVLRGLSIREEMDDVEAMKDVTPPSAPKAADVPAAPKIENKPAAGRATKTTGADTATVIDAEVSAAPPSRQEGTSASPSLDEDAYDAASVLEEIKGHLDRAQKDVDIDDTLTLYEDDLSGKFSPAQRGQVEEWEAAARARMKPTTTKPATDDIDDFPGDRAMDVFSVPKNVGSVGAYVNMIERAIAATKSAEDGHRLTALWNGTKLMRAELDLPDATRKDLLERCRSARDALIGDEAAQGDSAPSAPVAGAFVPYFVPEEARSIEDYAEMVKRNCLITKTVEECERLKKWWFATSDLRDRMDPAPSKTVRDAWKNSVFSQIADIKDS
ncbi:MAG: hypothetical protein EA385_15255 [Salinarimonadaceae bacterium]|nr:MAG: hypothetical protein EA385_15255 [Salinarimonadaceae bacterium]